MSKAVRPDKPNRRRLFFDIETSPNIGLFWSAGYKLSIGHENIVKERAVICIAWKWEGERAIRSLQWDKKQSDKKMIAAFVPVMDQADELVAHNGDRFDIAWLRTRCLKHGIPMNHTYVTLDTLKVARAKFRFNSNRLDYIAKFLGLGGKDSTGFQLWKDILLHNSEPAMRKMVKYCKKDVKLLEQVWEQIGPYVPAKSSVGSDTGECPECGSRRLYVDKPRVTAAGYRKVSLQCQDCGKYHTVSAGRFEKDTGADV